MSLKQIIDGLNPAQKEAVLHNKGPLMVLAGAGSGKTRTLVAKIAYLIEEERLGTYQIMALTFSNRAAKEMRDRVSRMIKMDMGALQITTFHSFCAQTLRKEARYLGLGQNFTIYDDSESKAVVKAILQKRGISLKETSPYEVLYYIAELKNTGHYLGIKEEEIDYEVDTDDPFYDYYKEYEEELAKANAVDFGGLITGTLKLLSLYPEVLARYQERFKYLLIDEYQDTNRAQFRLIEKISKLHKNICVVGDEDQSIYSWRGADIRNILDFEETFPSAKLLKLEQNYRSSQIIIDAASHVIEKNVQRKGKRMWTENPTGEEITIQECENERREAEFIVEKIKSLARNGERMDEVAIFYRANSQSRALEDALRQRQISYRVIGGIKFYERKEIKDMLSYLKILANPQDSLAISRILNVPTRGIGALTLRKIEGHAVDLGTGLWDALAAIVHSPEDAKHLKLSARVRSSLNHFVSLLEECQLLDEKGERPSVIYEKLLMESGYWESVESKKDYESKARLENLEELGHGLQQFETSLQEKTKGVQKFLETITLDSSKDNENQGDDNTGEVSLMTVHGSKGLEFGYVFVCGLEENVFPSYQGLESGDDQALEEERRLFYVAMTRAMKRLFLCFARGRMLFGQVRFNGPSRFLFEIPDEYYNWLGRTSKEQSDWDSNTHESWDDFSQETPYSDGPAIIRPKVERNQQSTYSPGLMIKHSVYGEGVVLESEGTGGEEKVVIQFPNGAKKKFMVKFAPITPLA